MNRLLLIRHMERENAADRDDRDQPLSLDGKNDAEVLRGTLVSLGLQPDFILSSSYLHAWQTAEIIAGSGFPNDCIQLLPALTPKSDTEGIAALLAEAGPHVLEPGKTIALVGHEPRLSQLLEQMTGARARPLKRKDVVVVDADCADDLLKGKGKQYLRWPVSNYQEEALRGKVSSKMTVSTFLAGFTSSVLFMLLDAGGSLSGWQIASALLLTASLALFIASVYIYDRLSMPEGFWAGFDRRGPWVPRGKQFEEDCKRNGDLYAHMIWAWKYVFTPGLAFGLLGFLAFLLHLNHPVLTLGALIILAAGFAYYSWFRPRLGVD